MRTSLRTHLAIAVTLGMLATLALAGTVQAHEATFTAQLAGVAEGENPGNPDGSGSATITLDPDTGEVCWDMTAEGIGAVTQSHIHEGAEGVSGGVVVPLDVEGFEGSSEGCVEDQDADVLQAIHDSPEGYYVNLHTEDFPAGAIRGQLTATAQPDTAVPVSGTSPVALIGILLALSAAILGLRRLEAVTRR